MEDTLSIIKDTVLQKITEINHETIVTDIKEGVFLTKLKELMWVYCPKLIAAILVFIVGWFLISWLMKIFKRRSDKSFKDPTLGKFLGNLIGISLKVILIITVVGMLGVQVTSFVALLGTAGLAVGLALQGSLQNFAAGVMILIFRPYRVGDYIEAAGQAGTIKEIQIFNTIITTVDNKVIIIPNSAMSAGAIKNYSKEETRRVDWTFGIGYGDSYDQAKAVIQKLADADERILKDPIVFIALDSLGDSSVNIVVRAWVKAENYWGVYFDMNEKVYKTFAEEHINIPFPQMDVHLHQ
ncbi:MAG: mechanosensitive ion channel [Bacteroidales bacterium]|nr:mechanosensitive ion channel [Bacteroidales bacterium]